MKQIVLHFIKKHKLLFAGAKVIVGVSGGPDSLALLHFLWKYREYYSITIIAAHAEHGLRGLASEEDYHFVESFCNKHSINFIGKKLDVIAYQKKEGVSVQVAARDCRYAFFKEVLLETGSHILALGHHGDDQIETMLMRQVRGAYGSSLSGIPVKRSFYGGTIIRPFLAVCKDEIIQYCIDEVLEPRSDASNDSQKYTRNRFRTNILPSLKRENPSVHLRFQQQSELLKEDEDYLTELTHTHLKECIMRKESDSITLSVEPFKNLPIPLQRRGFHLILKYLYGHSFPTISTIHISNFIHLINADRSFAQIYLPKGLKVIKSYNQCIISFCCTDNQDGYHYRLSTPGIVQVKKGKILSEELNAAPSFLSKNQALFDATKLSTPLYIRTRKKGDRICVKGMNGSKK
ncbi:MAG: tRNA lysidine(34) synthetase TilS [Bacillaceae bacterium]|nr:tRNA lysidine(34) synthetase TilS [Bacillaceae bacterium]